MTKLSTAQQTLLQSIAGAQGGLCANETDRRTAGALIKRGHVISLPNKDGSSRFAITQAGRAAAGMPEPAASLRRPAATVAPPAPTKTQIMRDLLARREGATVAQMSEATGWLAHSVRGFMAGTLKKKLGLIVTSEKTNAGRIYRLTTEATS
jgi:hypothetical protein